MENTLDNVGSPGAGGGRDRGLELRRTTPHPRIHNHLDVRRCDIIGDVHGCYDELVELLEKLGHAALLDPSVAPAAAGESPRLIFVGDLVDRGDRILDVLRLVLRLCRQGHALMVVGNHDDRFLRWLWGRRVQVKHGLEQTTAEFNALPRRERDALRQELIRFLTALPWALRIDDGHCIVAHAAWHAELHEGPSSEHLRSYTLYGPTTGNKTPEGFPERIDWAPYFEGPELVVFGHQVYDTPYVHRHAVGIDTGCVFGGALTALRYPSMELVSIPSRGARYERGGSGRRAK
jgi:protein phosphatase